MPLCFCYILELANFPIKDFFLKILIEQHVGIGVFVYHLRDSFFLLRDYRWCQLFILNIVPVHLTKEFVIFYLACTAFYSKTFLRVFVCQSKQKIRKIFAEFLFYR